MICVVIVFVYTLGSYEVGRLAPEKRGMSMVSQRPLLFLHLNVIDNILDGFENRSTTVLSGGQQQRVALVRALAARPAVLLDEPFRGLDQERRHDMHDVLRQVRDIVHPSVLLVTHDRDEAVAVADSIARPAPVGKRAPLHRR